MNAFAWKTGEPSIFADRTGINPKNRNEFTDAVRGPKKAGKSIVIQPTKPHHTGRPARKPKKMGHPPVEVDLARAQELRNAQQLSLEAIAKAMGIGEDTLRKALRAAKVKLQPLPNNGSRGISIASRKQSDETNAIRGRRVV